MKIKYMNIHDDGHSADCVIKEIVDLLNDNKFRDCEFSFSEKRGKD